MTTTRRYAERTRVPVDRSRAEIERILARYGADGFMYGWNGDSAVVAFRAQERHVRFELAIPNGGSSAAEQETRQRWRALVLVIKAKLEAIESGISTFDDEFLAHIVLPDGQTAGEWLRPQIATAYAKGAMPAELRLALPKAGATS